LQEGQENANIDTGLGFIWRISAETIDHRPSTIANVSWDRGGEIAKDFRVAELPQPNLRLA
jgi:hypothetical protein